jgi:hypothetical protein
MMNSVGSGRKQTLDDVEGHVDLAKAKRRRANAPARRVT